MTGVQTCALRSKEVEDYKEKGISVPKKVSGSTKPRKGQALKETVRTVKN